MKKRFFPWTPLLAITTKINEFTIVYNIFWLSCRLSGFRPLLRLWRKMICFFFRNIIDSKTMIMIDFRYFRSTLLEGAFYYAGLKFAYPFGYQKLETFNWADMSPTNLAINFKFHTFTQTSLLPRTAHGKWNIFTSFWSTWKRKSKTFVYSIRIFF